ncbi:hypothetical protein F2Q68_00007810 [Brassica cretica]|uniref:non-specific serine/threonine protein kinase n=1 Tax=Brassica cretica TaxID=69181 RepID=A0A8S9KRP9_BRACR|nr:hypothetical protein F2Q68_00007810 [Brassica cretica]
MVRSLGILLLIIRTLAIIHIVQAQSQQANEPSPYKEEATGLQFSSDATFIQSGKTGRIHPTVASRFLKPYTTLRYFPDGTRNCYDLRVEKDLHKLVNGTREEIIHIPTSNKLQVCLVKTGPTTPLISTLEVRPMGNDSYSTQSGSLNLFFRFYFSESKTTLRYPDDVYDRQWTAYFWKEWTQITTTSNVGNTNDYEPPKAALATAAIPTNASEPLTLEWSNTDKPDDQYYLYRHFAEIQDLRSNETREFNMVWNGELMSSDPLVPDEFKITTILSLTPRTCAEGECSFQLKRTNRSTLPPLLNAFEVYTVIQFPQSDTNENEVVAIRNIEATYGLSRINWQGDPCVPSQLMWDALNCSHVDISTPPRITSLNLSSSGLTGNIAAAIQNLTLLEKLDLSNNNLTGEVPEFLGNMKLLLVINLSGNDLNGSIPQSLQRKGLVLSLEGNPRLFPSGSPEKTYKKTLLVPIVASVGSVAILIAALVLYLVLRKKKQPTVEVVRPPPSRPTVNVTNANSPEPSIEMKKRRFTYSEVIKMTNNFERVVGEGGFGVVCHGTVNGGQVAVKLLSQSSTQGYKEFKAEVDLLLRVHHTNLVSLVGYCDEGDHLALIYEFVPNGDLRQHLTGKGGRSVVNWGIRLRIAVEAALGLEYLHIGCTPPMVHRDVKTTNILLDEHYKAKLADFGLSRSFPVGGESHVSTVVAGTPGYLDPEYYHTGRLGEKSDVYSFGIVLLEMITNQSVIDRNRRNSHITQWVGDLSNNNLTGEVPEFLGNLKFLLLINLSGNDLNGSVPTSLQRKGLELSLQGNPRLLVPSSSPTKPPKKSFVVPVVASVGSVAILIAALVLYLVLRKKRQPTIEVVCPPPSRPTVNVTHANSPEPSIEMKKRRFTYSEVTKMTNNFERVVGEGGFGVVCHGTVNGEQVAVKLLSQSSTQGYKEFKAEVDLLLRVHHTNLVSLVGYCDDGDHLALIYEFVPNGDLRQHLSGKGGRSVVNWGIRLRIAVEAALGLEYLHIGCTPPMVHRDVKTTNILLDEHYKAKLADFGLSRSFPVGGESHVSTVVAGTPGYLDPE